MQASSPPTDAPMKAVILAAGMGSRLAPLTNDRPKCLVEVGGRPILFRQLDQLRAVGWALADVVIVAGYKADVLRAGLAAGGFGEVVVVDNPMYEPWNNFWSLAVAAPAVGDHGVLQFDGDVLLDERLLPRVLAAPGEAVLAVDCRPELDDETMKAQLDASGAVIGLSKQLPAAACAGEYIGISRLAPTVAAQVFAELHAMKDAGRTGEYYEYGYYQLIARGAVRFDIVDVHDCSVTEIDNVEDLARADAMLRARG
ncbi:MAG: phosphocholine cytidylyltransferase family protein [Kofleriaceae bacterium]